MNKKLVGVLLLTGAAAMVVATKNLWEPALKAGLQGILFWAMDDEDEGEEVKAYGGLTKEEQPGEY